jgi:hypothetical protein
MKKTENKISKFDQFLNPNGNILSWHLRFTAFDKTWSEF